MEEYRSTASYTIGHTSYSPSWSLILSYTCLYIYIHIMYFAYTCTCLSRCICCIMPHCTSTSTSIIRLGGSLILSVNVCLSRAYQVRRTVSHGQHYQARRFTDLIGECVLIKGLSILGAHGGLLASRGITRMSLGIH